MTEKKAMPVWMADILLVCVTILWGGGFIAVETSVDQIPPFCLLFIRFFIGSLLLCICFYKKWKDVHKTALIGGVVVGVLLFISFGAQTFAAQYITSGKLAFLTALNVVLVPFFAYLSYKEKLHTYHLFASALAIAGVMMLSISDGSMQFGVGDWLGVACAVGFAAHIVAVGLYAKKIDPILLTMLQMIVAMVLAGGCALVFESIPSVLPPSTYIPLLYLGVGSTFLCFLLQNIAQKYTTASHTSLIFCLEAVFGALFSVVLLGEVLTKNMLVGSCMILSGVVFSEWMSNRKSKVENNNENMSENLEIQEIDS